MNDPSKPAGFTDAEWKAYLQQRKDFEAGVVQPPEPLTASREAHERLFELRGHLINLTGDQYGHALETWTRLNDALARMDAALAGAPVAEPRPPQEALGDSSGSPSEGVPAPIGERCAHSEVDEPCLPTCKWAFEPGCRHYKED